MAETKNTRLIQVELPLEVSEQLGIAARINGMSKPVAAAKILTDRLNEMLGGLGHGPAV